MDAIKSDDLQGAVSSLTSHANEEVKKLAEGLKEKLQVNSPAAAEAR